jgi:hypothetical protein
MQFYALTLIQVFSKQATIPHFDTHAVILSGMHVLTCVLLLCICKPPRSTTTRLLITLNLIYAIVILLAYYMGIEHTPIVTVDI